MLGRMQSAQAKASGAEKKAGESEQAPRPRNRHFALFDALRAVAVGLVLLIHLGHFSGTNGGTWYGLFTSRGNLGVTIFFLISGFLLYRPWVVEQLGGPPAPSTGVYARRRVLRILPAYWLALTVLAVWPGLTDVFSRDFWVYYGLFNSYHIAWMLRGIPVTWSLSVEVAFYAALPLLAALLGRATRGCSRRRLVVTQLGLLLALGAASVAFRSWVWIDGRHHLPWTLPCLFLWFALGMGLAVVSAALEGREDRWAPTRWVREHGDAIWLLAAFSFVAAAFWPGLPRGMSHRPDLAAYTAEHLLYAWIALLLMLPVAFGEDGPGRVRRALASPGLAWLGRISYGIFLWHYPLTRAFAALGGLDWIPGQPFLSLTLSVLPVSILCGWASYRFVEQPAMRLRGSRRPGPGA